MLMTQVVTATCHISSQLHKSSHVHEAFCFKSLPLTALIQNYCYPTQFNLMAGVISSLWCQRQIRLIVHCTACVR